MRTALYGVILDFGQDHEEVVRRVADRYQSEVNASDDKVGVSVGLLFDEDTKPDIDEEGPLTSIQLLGVNGFGRVIPRMMKELSEDATMMMRFSFLEKMFQEAYTEVTRLIEEEGSAPYREIKCLALTVDRGNHMDFLHTNDKAIRRVIR